MKVSRFQSLQPSSPVENGLRRTLIGVGSFPSVVSTTCTVFPSSSRWVSSEISLISSSSTTPGSFGSVDKVRVCYQTIEN
ncbi:hypothetical protein Q3G72_024079 [Acer saccharum]|nr:hypothetical protein Q3G72_024079 [Acer saccharum]